MSDTNRKLRHQVRLSMMGYFKHHQEDYDAFMALSSVMFLLGGKAGYSAEQRAERVTLAHDSVAAMVAKDEFDSYLISAHMAIHDLMKLVDGQIAEVALLDQYEKEFVSDPKE